MSEDRARPPAANVLVEVRALLPVLHPAERRIADALLGTPEQFATMSISDIAEASETSTATVVRFTRRFGYQRFRDFRHALTEQNLRERLARPEDAPAASDITRGDSLDEIVRKVAATESSSLADTAAGLDTAALARAVELVTAATRVDLYGVGASALVAVDLQRKLTRIGRVALEWSESHAAWTAAAVLGSDAVAIAVSHSGATNDTVEFLQLARAAGAATIAITNHEHSPLAGCADVVLRTAARESAFRSGALGSRIAQLLVADCLYIGVATGSFDRSQAALQKTYGAVLGRGAREPRAGGSHS